MTVVAERPAEQADPSPSARAAAGARTRAPRNVSRRPLPLWATLVFVFLFLPIAVVIVYSFNVGRLLISWDHFGFDSFAAIVTKPVLELQKPVGFGSPSWLGRGSTS